MILKHLFSQLATQAKLEGYDVRPVYEKYLQAAEEMALHFSRTGESLQTKENEWFRIAMKNAYAEVIVKQEDNCLKQLENLKLM